MTPRELNFALKDFSDRENDHYKTQWETMRLQTMILLNPHLKKESMNKEPTKFMPLPWDHGDPGNVNKQSVEEMKATLMAIASTQNKHEEKKKERENKLKKSKPPNRNKK